MTSFVRCLTLTDLWHNGTTSRLFIFDDGLVVVPTRAMARLAKQTLHEVGMQGGALGGAAGGGLGHGAESLIMRSTDRAVEELLENEETLSLQGVKDRISWAKVHPIDQITSLTIKGTKPDRHGKVLYRFILRINGKMRARVFSALEDVCSSNMQELTADFRRVLGDRVISEVQGL